LGRFDDHASLLTAEDAENTFVIHAEQILRFAEDDTNCFFLRVLRGSPVVLVEVAGYFATNRVRRLTRPRPD
jgi:hypothetical protein